jgi:hypothetical protein
MLYLFTNEECLWNIESLVIVVMNFNSGRTATVCLLITGLGLTICKLQLARTETKTYIRGRVNDNGS